MYVAIASEYMYVTIPIHIAGYLHTYIHSYIAIAIYGYAYS